MDRLTLASRMLHFRSGGMMGTSDFSSLFANVANKRLRAAYDENAGTTPFGPAAHPTRQISNP